MSELVNPAEIEQIVGAKRHPTRHIGRAIESEQTVYILHSRECVDSGINLRRCDFSLALDAGIHRANWETAISLGVPVWLEVIGNLLVPTGRADQ